MTYLLIINALGFITMALDKIFAKAHIWRIPESVLMGVAIIGGSLGSNAGMMLCRHKTKHAKFRVGLPVILLFHLIILYLCSKFLSAVK